MIRLIDILLSLFALLILMPIFIPVMIVLKFTGEKEIFYLQDRLGVDSNNFKLYKFTTMLKDSENIGTGAITIKNDPRVLPFGKFLRKSKINELPQIINILLGDMSFVGPRPLLKKQFKFYNSNDQETISSIRPGLTGVGSLVFRDEERFFVDGIDPDEIYKEKISPIKADLEVWYVNNRTIWLYLKLILATFLAVIFPSKNFLYFIDKDLGIKYESILE